MRVDVKWLSLFITIVVLLASTISFQFNTWATKKEVAKQIEQVKNEVQRDVEQKHGEVKQQIKQVQHSVNKMDSRVWQILKEVKKITN